MVGHLHLGVGVGISVSGIVSQCGMGVRQGGLGGNGNVLSHMGNRLSHVVGDGLGLVDGLSVGGFSLQ